MIKKLFKTYFDRLRRNFYLAVALFFTVWMLFFDTNDWISQYQLRKKVRKLKADKEYYLKQIKKVKKDRKELLTDKKHLEKYAREKYLMKKPSEDLFVIEYE